MNIHKSHTIIKKNENTRFGQIDDEIEFYHY